MTVTTLFELDTLERWISWIGIFEWDQGGSLVHKDIYLYEKIIEDLWLNVITLWSLYLILIIADEHL